MHRCEASDWFLALDWFWPVTGLWPQIGSGSRLVLARDWFWPEIGSGSELVLDWDWFWLEVGSGPRLVLARDFWCCIRASEWFYPEIGFWPEISGAVSRPGPGHVNLHLWRPFISESRYWKTVLWDKLLWHLPPPLSTPCPPPPPHYTFSTTWKAPPQRYSATRFSRHSIRFRTYIF